MCLFHITKKRLPILHIDFSFLMFLISLHRGQQVHVNFNCEQLQPISRSNFLKKFVFESLPFLKSIWPICHSPQVESGILENADLLSESALYFYNDLEDFFILRMQSDYISMIFIAFGICTLALQLIWLTILTFLLAHIPLNPYHGEVFRK